MSQEDGPRPLSAAEILRFVRGIAARDGRKLVRRPKPDTITAMAAEIGCGTDAVQQAIRCIQSERRRESGEADPPRASGGNDRYSMRLDDGSRVYLTGSANSVAKARELLKQHPAPAVTETAPPPAAPEPPLGAEESPAAALLPDVEMQFITRLLAATSEASQREVRAQAALLIAAGVQADLRPFQPSVRAEILSDASMLAGFAASGALSGEDPGPADAAGPTAGTPAA